MCVDGNYGIYSKQNYLNKQIEVRGNRRIPRKRELFPDPVLPTIPTLDPGLIKRLTPLSTGSKSSLYLIFTFK